jgi:hypothetical protein
MNGYAKEYRDERGQADVADAIGTIEDLADRTPVDSLRVHRVCQYIATLSWQQARAISQVAWLLRHADTNTKREFADTFAVPSIQGDG